MKQGDILDNYDILTNITPDSSVLLIRSRDQGEILISKILYEYNIEVIDRLKEAHIPGIPQIYDYQEEDDHLITVEEYIHGQTLAHIHENCGNLSEKTVIDYVIQICKILRRLHQMKPAIIHRDIKPDNIMLSNDGVIKLIDFNGSKEKHENARQDTVLFGTHHYAAPEQYGFGQSDSRTDIYQLGVTMNVLLCDRYPIDGLYQGQLAPIIDKCLAFDPNRRYQTVDELEDSLIRYGINHFPDSAARYELPKKNLPPAQKGLARYLPPGYRTKKIWKMFLASVVYFYLISICFTMSLEDHVHEGQYLTGPILYLERFMVFLIFFFPILIFFNYCNVWERIPGRNRLIKGIFAIGMIILFAIGMAVLAFAIETIGWF